MAHVLGSCASQRKVMIVIILGLVVDWLGDYRRLSTVPNAEGADSEGEDRQQLGVAQMHALPEVV